MTSLKVMRIFIMLLFLSSDMYLYLHGEEQVAYLCHIAGGCTGSLLGLTILKNITVERYEKYVRAVGALLFSLSSIVATVAWMNA